MGKEVLEILSQSSFNGAVVALRNSLITPMPSDHTLTSSPHVLRLPILRLETGILYIPNEWASSRILVKNLLLTATEYDPNLLCQRVMMSVIPADLVNRFAEDIIAVFPADSKIIYLDSNLTEVKLHPTHNLILSWVDDYDTAESVNHMM